MSFDLYILLCIAMYYYTPPQVWETGIFVCVQGIFSVENQGVGDGHSISNSRG